MKSMKVNKFLEIALTPVVSMYKHGRFISKKISIGKKGSTSTQTLWFVYGTYPFA
jgi:hypothetical protein